MAEDVPVPAGRRDAGGVAGPVAQLAVAPGHPRDDGLGRPRRCLGERGIGRRGGERWIEGGDVPRPAHDGDTASPGFGERRSDGAAHVRLTTGVDLACAGAGPHSPHRFGDGIERRRAVTTVLDHIVPPPLGVGLAAGCGERGDGVEARPGAVGLGAGRGERPADWHIDRPDDPVVGERPAHRLPLRAELRERPEGRTRDVGGVVAEERDRRAQLGMGDPGQHRRGVGGQLDEHDDGCQLVERPQHRARRAGPVMADAEHVQAGRRPRGLSRGFSRGRGTHRRNRPSRHDRAPPPRGTRATPRRRARDRARRRRRLRRPRRPGRAGRRRNGWRGRARW